MIMQRDKLTFLKSIHFRQHAELIIVVFGLILLAFFWMGLYYKIQAEKELEIDNAYKQSANLVRTIEEHTLRTIKGVDQKLIFLKFQYEKEGASIDIPQYIREGMLDIQPLVLLSVINENGDLVVSSQVPFVPSNMNDREHFLVHKFDEAQGLFISKPVLGRSSGRWAIQLTRRINKPDGSFGGVAVASVDPYYFAEFYKQVDLGDNSVISLVGHDDGIIRVRESNSNLMIGSNVQDSPLMHQLLDSPVGNFTTASPIDGDVRIYSYRALREYPLVVMVGMDEKAVLYDLHRRIADYYRAGGLFTAVVIAFISLLLHISARRKSYEEELREARDSLENEVQRRTQELIRQEKMAGIGQLAAGVAHEINNPLGFISINIETLGQYFAVMGNVLGQYRGLCTKLSALDSQPIKGELEQINDSEQKQDLDYILGDFPALLEDTVQGLERISKIVKGMRFFSRSSQRQDFEEYDLSEGLESTLLVAQNEYKHCAKLEKNVGFIPHIEAIGGKINQVLLNLIINAAQAIKAKECDETGVIIITTWYDADSVYCSVEDNGVGIAEQNLAHIFDPFFTTKPAGQGTGMGLSISYDIIVNKHKGKITVDSSEGKGAKFTIKLPVRQKHANMEENG